MARFTHTCRTAIAAGVVVAVATMTAWAGFDPIDEDFSADAGGLECATWDETTGGQAPGSAKFEPVDDTTTLSCGGDGGFTGPELTWPSPFTLSYWMKMEAGATVKTHFNVFVQNTTSWEVAWFGLVNWDTPWEGDSGEVTMDFPDFKTLSNPWEDATFEEKAPGVCIDNGWDEANCQIMIGILYEIEGATVWYDDIVMEQAPQSVEPMHLTVRNAAQPRTRSLTIAPNGRLIRDVKKLNAASYLIELENGTAVKRAILRDR